jgi:hypothetical protein
VIFQKSIPSPVLRLALPRAVSILRVKTSILMMKGACPFKTTVSANKAIWCHNPEDQNLNKSLMKI